MIFKILIFYLGISYQLMFLFYSNNQKKLFHKLLMYTYQSWLQNCEKCGILFLRRLKNSFILINRIPHTMHEKPSYFVNSFLERTCKQSFGSLKFRKSHSFTTSKQFIISASYLKTMLYEIIFAFYFIRVVLSGYDSRSLFG